MKNSRIEWTDHTFNPWIGCTEVSSGCDNCYARETFDGRRKMVRWGACQPRHRTSPANWRQPYLWNAEARRTGIKPRVFCASLADVFDPEVESDWRDDLFALIAECTNLHWLLLTKRPDEARRYFQNTFFDWPWPHVWIGASVENQVAARERIPELLRIPAAGRFLSIEPMLGPVNVQVAESPEWAIDNGHLIGVDWIIAGGESGTKARPTHPNWLRALRDQCQHDGRPFLFKGWGEWASLGGWPGGRLQPYIFPDGLCMHRTGRAQSGCLIDEVEYKEVPACLL